jgi:hypothetical protein
MKNRITVRGKIPDNAGDLCIAGHSSGAVSCNRGAELSGRDSAERISQGGRS